MGRDIKERRGCFSLVLIFRLIKTMHNKLKKKWQNPLFQSSFTLFFLYIPKGARTITWPFCLPSTGKIQVQHPAGTRRTIKTTFSNRKRSQTIAQFILIAKGLQAIYTYLDVRSRFFQILAKYS